MKKKKYHYFLRVYKQLWFSNKICIVKSERTARFFAALYALLTFKKYPICLLKETGNFSTPEKIIAWIVPYTKNDVLETRKLDKVGEKNIDRVDADSIEEASEEESNIIISNGNNGKL